GRRFQTGPDFNEITKDTPEPSLTAPLRKSGGRNNLGRMTIRHRGGGHKRLYRILDFKRDKVSVPAKVAAIEYDPKRSALLALLKLPSGELRRVRLACRATIGQVGNLEHENISYGKAGRIRWLGRRSSVRGIAMNPVDHPHGGGEGRSKGNHPQTPWGKPTKGYKTRHNKRTNRFIVMRRKK